MDRVMIAAHICAALFICCNAPASAMAEFCPAKINIKPVGSGSVRHIGDHPAALYGFNLEALSARTVSVRLAFDTKFGWYTVGVPPVDLSAKSRDYGTVETRDLPKGIRYIQRVFVSPRMYIQFPSIVSINNAYVYTAKAENDAPFAWQSQGIVECPPVPAPDKEHLSKDPPILDWVDEENLSGSPSPRSLILQAVPSLPLESTSCAQPFKDVTIKGRVTFDFPSDSQYVLASITLIDISVNADGKVTDVSVLTPVLSALRDQVVLQAAKQATYESARAYCRAVPGHYLFSVFFWPASQQR